MIYKILKLISLLFSSSLGDFMSIPSQPGVTSASNISPHPIIVRPTKAEPFIVVDLQGKRFVDKGDKKKVNMSASN
jgi:hypothetical protein